MDVHSHGEEASHGFLWGSGSSHGVEAWLSG